MLNFISNAFNGVFEFCLWVNLIVCTIGGGAIGGALFYGHPILGGIIGFFAGLLSNVVYGGVVTIFMRIDANLKILVKMSGGQPVETGAGVSVEEPSVSAPPASFKSEDAARKETHEVIRETGLNNSLSAYPKTIRLLNAGEKVSVSHTLERTDLGGNSGLWALVRTQHDEGWCLFEDLREEK
jgi:hypothetical protein